MKVYYLILFALLFSVFSYGQTTTSSNVGSGNAGEWVTASSWSNGLPGAGMTIVIEAGETIFLQSGNVTIQGDPVHMIIYGVLEFRQAGKLELPTGSTIELIGDGDIAAPNSTNQSTVLSIGSVSIRSEDIDKIEGPATITESNLNCSGCAPTPVNLLYFTAHPQSAAVKLDWASSKAWDFSHYELERSADGMSFEYLATIDAEENTNWIVNYSYTDRQPLNGISYYRLKAVDIDGQFEYKGIEVVQFAGASAMKVYPNPSNRGVLHVQQSRAGDNRTNVSLKDNSGRTVYTGIMEASSKTIDTSSLQPGMYVLTIESAGGVQKKHVIIQ